MDESENPAGEETAADVPAKKKTVKRARTTTKKSAGPRSRKKEAAAETGELNLGDAGPPPSPEAALPDGGEAGQATRAERNARSRTRTRRPKTEREEPVPASQTASGAPATPPSAPEPAPPPPSPPAAGAAPAREGSGDAPRPAPVDSRPSTPGAASESGSDTASRSPVQERRPAPTGERRPAEKPADSSNAPEQREQNRDRDNNRERDRDDEDGSSDGDEGPWWKNKKDRKNKRGKKNKWKKGDPKDRPPPQPLPPGMEEVRVGDLPDPYGFEDLAALDAAAQAVRESNETPINLEALYPLGIAELGSRGAALGATLEGVPGRRQWLESIFRAAAQRSLPMWDHGWLDLTDDGYGFIVHKHVSYRLYPENAYVPASLIKRYGLKRGHEVEVIVRPPAAGERCPVVIGIESVMGRDPDTIAGVTPFEELEPYYPLQRIMMEATGVHKDISMRAVDLLTPTGFGQRGLIVAPPRTGKTVLLQNMANSISHNHPEAKLILLLIDERPEEVTDFKRHTKGEVVSSTFDEAPTNHVHAAEMVIEKARRLVELGQHVVILLDSITRLARAYNALASNSGKIMSGGIEATALQKPKRFFGSARNIEGGGSLTILGTALIDTNSRMDEVIFEEFKGTGNMELHLDRGLSDKRIFPAINIDRSGTRKEELIYHPDEMQRVYGLRRAMQGIPPVEAMEMFITRLRKTKTNAEFLMSLNR